MGIDPLTETDRAALDVARQLIGAGIPVFLAHPDPSAKTGYLPPRGWERTEPDPSIVDQWRPGLALCAVMGHGLDLVDIDPRNGGDAHALDGAMPRVWGLAATPSGGNHLFIRALGVGSRDNVYPGIDVKGGLPNGSGRGFAFIAPTVRASAVTGELVAYRWIDVPTPMLWDPADRVGMAHDTSGDGLAARIRDLRAHTAHVGRGTGGPDWWQEFVKDREPQSAPAAERAITTKLTEVAEWRSDAGVGFRTVLLRAALTLGGYVGGGYLDESDARGQLEEAVGKVWGAPDADDLKWIQQGLDDGAVMPFRVYTEEDAQHHGEAAQQIAAQGEEPDPGDAAGPPPWSVYSVLDPRTPFDPATDSSDQGLAEAVALRMYPALRYAVDSGSWVKRDRDVWVERADDHAEWIVTKLAKLMPLGQTPVPKELAERTEGHWQAVRRAQFMSAARSAGVVRKLRALVRADHPVCLSAADLDNNPEVLWAGGVPWDLRASEEVPTPASWIDPNTPHMRSAWVAPDSSCPTPRWDAFTAAVLPDPALREWALLVLSAALTGYADAVLPILYGRERSGKSSLISMLCTVLGTYAHAASPKLLGSQENSHEAIVYDLKGRRLSFIDEGPRRGHHATERLKQLTGGAPLTGRAMRANSVTFTPTHTLVMTANPTNEPHLTDPALRARLRIIPCDATESDVRVARLALLGSGLRAEAPGILASMMRRAARYLADPDRAGNAQAPIDIQGQVAELAQAQDPVREWVENCTVAADPGTRGRVLYTEFARWMEGSPVFRKTGIPSETSFGRTLTEMGYPPAKSGGFAVRGLSILGGPGGLAPWEPPAGRGDGPTVEGTGPTWRVDRGVCQEPSTDQNPSSSPISSSFMEGMEGYNTTYKEEINTQKVHTHNELQINTGGTLHPPTLQPPTPSAEVAKRASSATISKTQARRQLKEEQRQASIAAAAGEVLTLPAVVDRAGNVMPLSVDRASDVVQACVTRSGALTVDVETTGFPVGHRDYALRSVQLGDSVAAVVFDPQAHADTIRGLLAAAPKLRAHSATADLVPLAAAGLIDAETTWPRMHDTVIAAKLADPASTGSDPGLKKLAEAVLRDESVAPAAEVARAALFKVGKWLKETRPDTPLERSGWAQVDTGCTTMLRYAASDVLDTAALAQVLPLPPETIYARERLVQRMTARVTHHGVRLDQAHIAALTEQHTAGRAEAAARVRAFAVDNPGSDQQVGIAASQLGATLPTTATGRPSVAAGILEPLRDADGPLGEFVGAVLDYRHHDTVLGLYLEPYRLLCERGDGRARPTVYTLGTDTGRHSCVRPNLQQLSREGGIRACITADPGQLMISADFSGVEIRVAAALSQDPTLRQFLIDDRDLHTEVAAMVYGYAPDAVPKPLRYKVKRGVFGWLYGGGVPTLARQMGVQESIATRMVDALNALVPQLVSWSAHMREGVRSGQMTRFVSYSGRVIHLPRQFPHKASNYAIQGTARELLMDALIRWADTPWGNAVLFPVHDEVDVFVPADDAPAATAALTACMATELFGVRIEAKPADPSPFWQDSV
jgi:P4 family phage/plasmid primase-like protien